MLLLGARAPSLVASIIAPTTSLYRLLLRTLHVAALAEASQVVGHVGPIGENVVHLVGRGTTEDARFRIPTQDYLSDFCPVLRELLATTRLTLPGHYQMSDRLLEGLGHGSMHG